MVHPYRLVRAARRARVTIPTACALVTMETGNGANVYGHDPVPTGGCYAKGGKVTRANYRCYKHFRGTSHMQGVGPCQLTWYGYQDQADKAGGCWHPFFNMAIGFGILREHHRANGGDLRRAFVQYNGAGAAAVDYGQRAMNWRGTWSRRLKAAGF